MKLEKFILATGYLYAIGYENIEIILNVIYIFR